MKLQRVEVRPQSLERFHEVADAEQLARTKEALAEARERLGGRVVWNVNSTAVGGGVAEMLRPLLSYARGAELDARWLVIEGTPAFFKLTKRIHHALHGSEGDGEPLDGEQRRLYEDVLRENALELEARVREGDVVLLHDPQTAGLAPHLARIGARVVWRSHIGSDSRNARSDQAWEFLRPYLEHVHHLVFSRDAYVPPKLRDGRVSIIQPSIDAFSPKNADLDADVARTILVHVGLVEGPPLTTDHSFTRSDGTPGRVERRCDLIRMGRAPTWETPLVVQVSRWDPLKDPVGVMDGFARVVDGVAHRGPAAELVLAGPNVHGVADDPEADRVFHESLDAWRGLPHAVRNRITLACLPTADVDENAAIVNALQRHAAVIVQKSLQEGFGLTVTEGMWKARPVLASRVGGIQDQIEDRVSGFLLDDPTDTDEFAGSLQRVLDDPELAGRVGAAARERVRTRFLGVRHLLQYAQLLDELDRAA